MLQLGLIGLQAGDVEHQAAILQDLAVGIRNGEGIDQHVDCAAVFSAQYFLMVAQNAMLLHDFIQTTQAFRG